jgi:hypothetical protein
MPATAAVASLTNTKRLRPPGITATLAVSRIGSAQASAIERLWRAVSRMRGCTDIAEQ